MLANRTSLLWVSMLALAACKKTKHTPSVLVEIDATDPMSIQLSDGVGRGTVTIPIRQVNSYGVGVPGGSASLAIRGGDAALYTNTVEFDAHGYAIAKVEAPDGSVFDIQVQSAERTDQIGPPAVGYSITTAFDHHGLAPAIALPSHIADARRMVAGTDGVAVSHGDEVWWFPAEPGALPHQVADLPYDIAGLWSTHLDADGIADLVVWADSQLVLLRGRSGGGYGWGGAWSAQSRDVGGVSAGDVDGDRLTDLVVASTDGDGTIVEVLLGDGQWGYEVLPPLGLSYPVEGITATDDERDGIPDVTVLSAATGTLRRYSYGEDGWTGGSPPEINDYKAEPGSTLLPPLDLNNKGAPEIIIVGPPQTGQQEMVFYVLGTPPIKYPLAFRQFEYSYADVDGNGSDDVIALEQDVLNTVRYDDEGDRFISHAIQGFGEVGPIAARDFDDDGLADIAILTNGIGFYAGSETPDGDWTVSTPDWRGYGLNLLGPFTMGDLNGDQIIDVSTIDGEGELTLRTWTFEMGDDDQPTMVGHGSVALPGGNNPLDLAQCGNHLYALIGAGGNRLLFHARTEATTDSWRIVDTWTAPLILTGTHVACGNVASGVPGVAVAGVQGLWVSFANDGTEIGAGDLGPVDAIAMADTNGDGVDEVVGCNTSGCTITVGDIDNDGLDEVVESGTTTVLTGWGHRQSLSGVGSVSIANVDGGERLDVMAYDKMTGTLMVHRGLTGGVAPPAGLRAHRDLRGPVYVGDVDGDGKSELLSIDTEGDVVHTTYGDASTIDDVEDTGAPPEE
jgi:hypothetical protein